jgi:hypothetical protein
MTSDGVLRHPSYVGLRQDKPAAAVCVCVSSSNAQSRRRSAGPPAHGRVPRRLEFVLLCEF